jgi:hypothetical protein
MKSMAVALIVLGLASVMRADAPFAEQHIGSDDPLERLVSDLSEIDTPAPGLAGLGTYSIFIAVDGAPDLSAGVLGEPLPSVPPQMRELVRRGLAALPVLIRHLSDGRPTKLTMEPHPILMNRLFGDEYDPRVRRSCEGERASCLEAWIAQHRHWKPINGSYRIRIGDVCFVLIGQIVNRSLEAVRYQPSGNMYVNSPVMTPSLAYKVRADWDRLDAQGHEGSLRSDLKTGRMPAQALIRLRFYYPDAYATLGGEDAGKRDEFEAREKLARERKADPTKP